MAGDPIGCDDPAPEPEPAPAPEPEPDEELPLDGESNAGSKDGGSGCSATRTPVDGLWAALLAGLLALTVSRWRARRLGRR